MPLAIQVYGLVCYLGFLAALGYTSGWLADLVVPTGISDGHVGSTAQAIVVDLVLLSIFAVQHSVMARPSFKRTWTKLVPPAAERSTYVLFASAAVGLLLWQWQPLNQQVWEVDGSWGRAAVWALYAVGWGVVVLSTFMIGHFDLFGIKQVLQQAAYAEPGFKTPGLYKLVRHPIMLGFLIAFWAAPTMTLGRLVFAAVASAYIVVAVQFEEHDLKAALPEYTDYSRQVGGFLPRISRSANTVPSARPH